MFLIDKLLLIGSILMLLSIISSKFSTRLGMPVLVIFLALGMLAGSEGIGGIAFENYQIAHAIGTVALAIILFDGGMRSPLSSLKIAWQPSAVLATLGVLLTSAGTGLAAAYLLGLPLLEGLLLGSIVGSTDAAAVFSLLRSAGIRLRQRLSATLEIESGANDPMAIFLTVGLLQVLTHEVPLGPSLLLLFLMQMGIGLAVGLGIGRLAVLLNHRLNLAAAGLYPLLAVACGLLAFGLSALFQGSGHLAIYVAGVVLGNSKQVFQRGTLLFHDGLAWASQITMFVVLGLLSTPSQIAKVAGPSILLAGALIFIVRPLSVIPLLLPFRFNWREITLISWVGLKGAVPIILATYPLLYGLESGPLLFNVVFFVVLISAILQGSTLPLAARLLKLEIPPVPEPPLSLEISSLRDVDAEIVDYPVHQGSRAANRFVRDLALPEGAVVAMISRDKQVIPPRGSTRIHVGDHVFVVVAPESRHPVDWVFTHRLGKDAWESHEIPVRGTTKAGDVMRMYNIDLQANPHHTLEELIRRQGQQIHLDMMVEVGAAFLHVREVEDGRIITVGLVVPKPKITSELTELPTDQAL